MQDYSSPTSKRERSEPQTPKQIYLEVNDVKSKPKK